LGAGIVGSQVARVILNAQSNVKHPMALNCVLVRDINRARDGIPADILTTDPERVLNDDRNDIIVEAMGGEEPARSYMAAALNAGKHVVTANKEALAKHGDELTRLAIGNRVSLSYEASVGGGIPVLAVIQDSLSANRIESIRAIINGTTNYVLSSMEEAGRSFRDALAEAQALGYAETDPTADVDAHDAVYKLSILARLAFGASAHPDAIHREGIRRIGAKDLRYASALGFTIKLLAIARSSDDGVRCRVHPALVPVDVPMAKVSGVLNAVELNGDLLGPLWLQGRGAGPGPTASAVMGDVLRIAKSMLTDSPNRYQPSNGSAATQRANALDVVDMQDLSVRYYVRLSVIDRFGVLAKIAGVFGEAQISIASVLQFDSDNERGLADLVIMTHPAREGSMQEAAARLRQLDVVASLENLIRVEDYDAV
jgi:homoserine dehydrogenase